MFAETSSSLLTSEGYLLAGISTMAAVIGMLWKLVMARARQAEKDNGVMAARIIELEKENGLLKGELLIYNMLGKSCKKDDCPVADALNNKPSKS